MPKSKRHSILYSSLNLACLVLCLVFSTTRVLAQKKEVKRDSLQLKEGISGLVEYEYDTSKGEEVYDGKFYFQSVTSSPSEDFDYQALTYQGRFSSNLKSGNWSFSDKKMKEENQKFVSGFKVGKLASGIEKRVSGEFQEGKAVGSWKATTQDYVNSEVIDTLFYAESTFKNNQLAGFLKSGSKTVTLQGYFNADGYFHGDWEIKLSAGDKSVNEIRTYQAGILKSYTMTIDGQSFSISYTGLDTTEPGDDEQWQDYSLEEGYFDILNLVEVDIKESVSSSLKETINEFDQKSNQFIKNSILAFSYHSEFDIWNSLKGSKPLGLGKFKVRRFGLTSNEKQQVQEIDESFKKIQSILKEFSNNPKVEIGKPVYEKLNEAELIFNAYSNALNQLKRMVDVITSDAFEYVDRTQIYPKICPELQFPSELTYEFQSEEVTSSHTFPKVPDQEDFDLDKMNLLIKHIKEDIKDIDEELDKFFEAMEIEKSLSNDEERLVEKKEKIESLFDTDSKEEGFNKYHEKYSKQVTKLAQGTFDTYSKLEVDEKKHKIKSLLSCYDNLIEFYIFLKDLKSKTKRLDDAYTNITFNPFIMADMSERIKENIYKAFDDYLKPYLLDKLSKDFSCETLDPAMQNIDAVYKKMIELSKRDTKEVEKALKREKNPEAILSVLELKLKN